MLESFGIMDYSLLLGVHNIDQAHREGEVRKYSTVQYSIVWYSIVQYSTVQYSTV